MPGGPNSNVTDPATTPPPMTRSSSATPVGSGRAASVETSHRGTAAGAAGAPGGLGARAGSKVFHSPHDGHRPTQRGEDAAQSAQRKKASARAREPVAVAMAAR